MEGLCWQSKAGKDEMGVECPTSGTLPPCQSTLQALPQVVADTGPAEYLGENPQSERGQ